jgi:hypothetical protein
MPSPHTNPYAKTWKEEHEAAMVLAKWQRRQFHLVLLAFGMGTIFGLLLSFWV